MSWLVYIAIGLVAVAAFLYWGFVRIKERTADAIAALRTVDEDEIPRLVQECIRTCQEKLGIHLNLAELQESAENLDFLLEPKQRLRTKNAFERSDHPGHFVMPLGAFMGELVRTHRSGARWVQRKGGGLAMDIPQGDITLTMHPFDKVLKHGATGKSGEILAYLSEALGNPSSEGSST